MCDSRDVNRREFLSRARRYARMNGLEFFYDPTKGKGSHATVRVGEFWTTVQYGDIPRGTLASMLKALNIDRKDF